MMVRLAILIIAPLVLTYVFVTTLWRELKHATRYAIWECQTELKSISAAWRRKSIRPENRK
jgi:hypothetical protein